jgi:NDP-sugar pyrophosphorylase family protein
MTSGMDAVLLAGGRGTRLAPLTITVPKPLLPLGERPIIDVLITQLAAVGVKRVFVCLGYLAPLSRASRPSRSAPPAACARWTA